MTRKKREAEFQTKFNLWLKYNWKKTSVFELKITETNRLPFTNIAEHQIRNLLLAKHSKVIYKIPDLDIVQKPFDSLIFVSVSAYLVVQFYHRSNKEFFIIDIDNLVAEIKYSGERSLTEIRARIISTMIGDFI